eukprot:m.116507 g.116507  ORF g.116507 m.116507 type:complete len:343 (-) comp14233_c0_seq1:1198-2226(-)
MVKNSAMFLMRAVLFAYAIALCIPAEATRVIDTKELIGMEEVLPDFIVVGVQKAGTTTLRYARSCIDRINKFCCSYLLDTHDSLCVSKMELSFFGSKTRSKLSSFTDYKRFLGKTLKDCRVAGKSTSRFLVGEKSPHYTWDKESLKEIKEKIPNVKIILSMREPLKRAISQYAHFHGKVVQKNKLTKKNMGKVPLATTSVSTSAMVKAFNTELACLLTNPYELSYVCDKYLGYLARGLYDIHLKRILALFPASQVFPMVYEDWTNPSTSQPVFDNLFRFLGVSSIPIKIDETRYNAREYGLCVQNLAVFQDFLRPHVEATEKLIGKPLDAWKQNYSGESCIT